MLLLRMLALFQQYYDLKSELTLPSSGKFYDPYDDAIFSPLANETLPQLMTRINNRRAAQTPPLPLFEDSELRLLVTLSLAESSSPQQLKTHFVPKAVTTEFSDAINFAKTLVSQRFYFNQQPFQTRQARASHCHACKLHKAKAAFSKTLTNTTEKLAGIKDYVRSPNEEALGVCGMCGCDLKNKVGFAITPILADLSPDQLQRILLLYGPKAFDVCWILKEALTDGTTARLLEAKVKHSGQRTENMLADYKSNKLTLAKAAPKDGKKT